MSILSSETAIKKVWMLSIVILSIFIIWTDESIIAKSNKYIGITGIEINASSVPDKNLRKYMLSQDINRDGALSDSELRNVKKVLLSKPVRDFTGISILKYMEYLCYPYHDLLLDYPYYSDHLDLSEMKYLEAVSVRFANEVICRSCPKLGRISMTNCPLKRVDLSGCVSLSDLEIVNGEAGCDYAASCNSIYLSDCRNLKRLSISGTNIDNLDLSGCQKIEYLTLENNNIKKLEMGRNFRLREVLISGSPKLSFVDFVNCKKLKSLAINGTGISHLDISDCTNLRKLKLDHNKLRFLEMGVHPLLKEVYITRNRQLEDIHLEKCYDLQRLDLRKSGVKKLYLSEKIMRNMRSLHIAYTRIKKLRWKSFRKLRSFDCEGSRIQQIDTSSMKELRTLSCGNLNLDRLDVSANRHLKRLMCEHTNISSLDLSNNPKLFKLYFRSTKIHFLDLRGCPLISWDSPDIRINEFCKIRYAE